MPSRIKDVPKRVNAELVEVGGQKKLLVHTDGPVNDPAWTASQVDLEDIVLAYMSRVARPGPEPALEAQP